MNDDCWSVRTLRPEQTEKLGRALASMLADSGGVVALYGELASGKTCFVRGMASQFARDRTVHSPTFTLINEYGDNPKLYHLDLYRIEGTEEAEDLGCVEIFESGSICAIEWAERVQALLPQRRLDVTFAHAGEDMRDITFSNRGLLNGNWQAALASALRGRATAG